jgi:hypothetical protein
LNPNLPGEVNTVDRLNIEREKTTGTSFRMVITEIFIVTATDHVQNIRLR